MIGKVSVGNSFGGIVNYLLNEKKNPEILDSNGVMLESKESIISSFNYQRSMNRNLGKAVWHSSISFAYPDKVDTKLMRSVANKYINEIGLSDTQFLVVKHNDRQHKHIHVLANRVDNNGDTVSDSFAANRTVKIMQSLEKSYELTVAKENTNQRKKELKNTIKAAIQNGDTLDQVFSKVEKIGYKVLKNKDTNDKITGVSYSIKSKGIIWKSSQVDRSLSYLKMEKLVEDVKKKNEILTTGDFESVNNTQVVADLPIPNEMGSKEIQIDGMINSDIDKESSGSEGFSQAPKLDEVESKKAKKIVVIKPEIKSVETPKIESEDDNSSTDSSVEDSAINEILIPKSEKNTSSKKEVADIEAELKPDSEQKRKEGGLFQTSFIEDLDKQQPNGSRDGDMFDGALSIQDAEKDTSTNQVVNEKDKLVDITSENEVSKEIPKESIPEGKQDVDAVKLSTDFSKSFNNEDLEYSKGEGEEEGIDSKTVDVNKKEEGATNQLPLFGQEERKEEVIKGSEVPTGGSFIQGVESKQKSDEQQEVKKPDEDEIIKNTAGPDKKPGESKSNQKVANPIKVDGKIGDSLEDKKSKRGYNIADKPEMITDPLNEVLSDKLANSKVSVVKGGEPIQSEKLIDKISQREKKPNIDSRGININEGKREKVVSNDIPIKEALKSDKTPINISSEPTVVKGNLLLSNRKVEGTVSEITVSPSNDAINFKLTCAKTKKKYSCSVSKKTWFKRLFIAGFQNGADASVGNNNVSILKVPKPKTFPITGIIDSMYKHNSENLLVINIVYQNEKNPLVCIFEGNEARKILSTKIKLGSKINATVSRNILPKEAFGFFTFKVENFKVEEKRVRRYKPLKVVPKMFNLFIGFLDLMAYMNSNDKTYGL